MKRELQIINTQSGNHRAGFTLIETFVAITILMLVIVGPITLAQRSLSSASLTREKIAAYFLAQDALEYVRNLRDNDRIESDNGIVGSGWDHFVGVLDSADCVDQGGTDPSCVVDTTQLSGFASCFSDWGSCSPLSYSPSRNVFRQCPVGGCGDDFEPSVYKRGLRITRFPLGASASLQHDLAIIVTVEWESQGFGHQEILLRDTLSHW